MRETRMSFILALTALLMPIATSSRAAMPTCEKLDAVISSSRDNFRSVSAKELSESAAEGKLQPAIYLPGAKKCRVDVEGEGIYECWFKTGTSLAGSEVWGPTNLSYLANLFDQWFAGCANYRGDYHFIAEKEFLSYKNETNVVVREQLSWSDGILTVTISPYREQ